MGVGMLVTIVPEEPVQTDHLEIAQRADRLRQALTQAGGIAAVSRKAKMPATTINNYLAGRDMKASALVALANACDVSLIWLAVGSGEMKTGGSTLPPWAIAFGETLGQPANFYIFCLLLASCQEYYARLGVKPSLSEVFEWVGQPYSRGFSMADHPIILAPPQGTN